MHLLCQLLLGFLTLYVAILITSFLYVLVSRVRRKRVKFSEENNINFFYRFLKAFVLDSLVVHLFVNGKSSKFRGVKNAIFEFSRKILLCVALKS